VAIQAVEQRIPPVSLRSRVGMTRLASLGVAMAGLNSVERNDRTLQRIPPVSLRSRVGMTRLASLGRRNDNPLGAVNFGSK